MNQTNPNHLDLLRTILAPAVALLNRLSLRSKFLLISFLFVLPLALLLALFANDSNHDIYFAQKERIGLAYLRPLCLLQQHIAEASLHTHQFNSGPAPAKPQELSRLHAVIANDLADLAVMETAHSRDLDTADLFQALNQHWGYLRTQSPRLERDDLVELHGKLAGDVHALMTQVGNTSNLILDPDLDSYYLMDAVLLKLPVGLDLLNHARSLHLFHQLKRQSQSQTQAALIVLRGILQLHGQELRRGLETAFQNNPAGNVKPALQQIAGEYDDALTELLASEERRSSTDSAGDDGGAAHAAAAGFRLWDHTAVELDQLLQARIARFQSRRMLTLAGIGMTLLLVFYLLLAFYVSVRRTVRRLKEATGRMVRGETDEDLTVVTSDELGQVAVAFNQIAARLRQECSAVNATNLTLQAQIVERQHAENSLRESEERFSLAVRGIQAGIWDWDPNRNHFYRSPNWDLMLGYTAGELEAGAPIWDTLVHPDDRERVLNALAEYIKRGSGEFRGEQRLRHKDGSYRQIVTHAAAVWDGDGLATRLVGSDMDVTEHQRRDAIMLATKSELDIARSIQQGLYPRTVPCPNGFEIAAASFPAEEVGGDYFDFISSPGADGDLLIALGDASGHGLGPALLMAQTRAALRSSFRHERHATLFELMHFINGVVVEGTRDEDFVTLLLLRLDVVTRQFHYGCAGHPAPIIMGADGRFRSGLDASGHPLGLLATPVFDPCPAVQLQPGDVLLLVSDGAFEARDSAGLLFGMDRLKQALFASRAKSADQIMADLYTSLSDYCHPMNPQDDITMIVIKVAADGDRHHDAGVAMPCDNAIAPAP